MISHDPIWAQAAQRMEPTDGCPKGFGECTIGPETGQVHIADLFGKLGGDVFLSENRVYNIIFPIIAI